MFVPKSVHLAALEAHEREREAWVAERRELLNRIQAPQSIPYTEPAEPSEDPLYVGPDDDQGFEDYIDDRAAGTVS